MAAAILLLAPLLPAKPPTYAQLAAKMAKAQGPKRAELLSQLALMDYDKARKSYEGGQSQAGAQCLAALEAHGGEAMALLRAEAAQGGKKGMKKVEIAFRKVVFGLDDLGHEANFQDQRRIEAARQRFADRRQQLLTWLFASKKRAGKGKLAWHA
ncbi:MAG: hypothetical protein ACRD2H_07825 [Terriglobales bacterium]